MKKKILVADDDPALLQMMEAVLKREGYEVLTAHNGQEALNLVRQQAPDLMILDIMMPKMDGPSVYSSLQSDVTLSKIPVIFLTALATSNSTSDEEGLLGTAAIMAKPVNHATLLRKVSGLLGA